MPSIPISQLIPVLQIAVGPVILISGVGLVLLTLTNRLGRAVDRARQLRQELRALPETDRPRLVAQVEIIYRRARLLRLSIMMAGLCVLLVAILIIAVFLTALMKIEVGMAITLLFIGCMATLIVSLIAFLRDIQLSLQALKLELEI